MSPGGVPTQAAGSTSNHVVSMVGDYVDTNVLRIRATLSGHHRDKYYAPFVNGQYLGYNVYAPIDTPLEILVTFTNGTTLGSFYLEDAGDYATFNSFVPIGQAQNFDALTSNRIYMEFASTYTISAVYGDTQLSAISITGAKRNTNVAQVQGWPTRGALSYSITTTGTTHVVRWWSDTTMVAEGSRVGDGALTCTAANGSGMSIPCTLTYTADLIPNVAFVELRWPKSFQIHYSTSPLVFPRSPEATVNDTGSDNYLFLTPVITNGSYNVDVLEVDDGGIVQTAGIPASKTAVLNAVPLPPTVTTITGTAAATTINWTAGEAGCTYTVYYSHVGMPIDLIGYAPASITTAADATSATLAAITDYTAVDTSTALATLKTAFDSAVATVNAAYTTGETGFAAALATYAAALKTAMNTYAATVWLRMTPWTKQLDGIVAVVSQQLATFNGLGLTTAQWQNQIGFAYAGLLGATGDMLEHNPTRYTLPNAAVGAGASGSATLGTGGMPSDGTSALNLSNTRYSLSDAAKPTIRPGKIRGVVRATKAGIQEKNDIQFEIEYTNAGAINTPRPNTATLSAVTATAGLTLSATGQTVNDDAPGVATILDFYAQTTSPIDLTNPQASVALADSGNGILAGTVSYTLPGAGWYYVAVAARTAAGARSLTAAERLLEFDTTGPGAVTSFSVKVVRGRGNRIG